MAGEQNPAGASGSSAFLAVETYRQARVLYSLEKKCDVRLRTRRQPCHTINTLQANREWEGPRP
eukprot:scaffold112276_cov30-Phaeocystis_antarctica.AAC.1